MDFMMAGVTHAGGGGRRRSRVRRRWAVAQMLVVTAISTAALSGCAVPGTPVAVSESSSVEVPPPTRGVLPPGADLHGFARTESRCDGQDDAIRMVWLQDNEFTVCRSASAVRYLRAWTGSQPKNVRDHPAKKAMRGTFFTDTANSVQFVADGAKVDIGPTTVTIVWPHVEGGSFMSSSLQTGVGWTRLD